MKKKIFIVIWLSLILASCSSEKTLEVSEEKEPVFKVHFTHYPSIVSMKSVQYTIDIDGNIINKEKINMDAITETAKYKNAYVYGGYRALGGFGKEGVKVLDFDDKKNNVVLRSEVEEPYIKGVGVYKDKIYSRVSMRGNNDRLEVFDLEKGNTPVKSVELPKDHVWGEFDTFNENYMYIDGGEGKYSSIYKINVDTLEIEDIIETDVYITNMLISDDKIYMGTSLHSDLLMAMYDIKNKNVEYIDLSETLLKEENRNYAYIMNMQEYNDIIYCVTSYETILKIDKDGEVVGESKIEGDSIKKDSFYLDSVIEGDKMYLINQRNFDRSESEIVVWDLKKEEVEKVIVYDLPIGTGMNVDLYVEMVSK